MSKYELLTLQMETRGNANSVLSGCYNIEVKYY